MEIWAMILAGIALLSISTAGVVYARRTQQSVEEYISARGSLGGLSATATTVASVAGAWVLFSPAEAATWAGLVAVVGYAIGQAGPIIAFLVIGPRIRALMPQGHSLAEFVWYRFGRPMYAVTLAIMILYMFTFLAAEMGASARAVGLVTGAPLAITLLLVGGATLAYAAYGGLRTSIFTDKIQFLLIMPLLVVIFAIAIAEIGGWDAAFQPLQESNPQLLSMSYTPGIEFGITLIIAITAANLFHQGFWQRVYAAKGVTELRTGFLLAAILVIPMIIAGGLFGLWAVGQDLINAENPGSIALFVLAMEFLPPWALIALVILAMMLVMSSMDTLLNGIASVITSDIPRIRKGIVGQPLLRFSRWVTVILILPAALVGWAFDSVLYLFLIADLVCAGAMIPVFLGMYSAKFHGSGAIVSSLTGIAAGAIFFPTRSLSGWWEWDELTDLWHLLASGNLLGSFLVAILVSAFVSAIFLGLRWRTREFQFESLSMIDVSLDRPR